MFAEHSENILLAHKISISSPQVCWQNKVHQRSVTDKELSFSASLGQFHAKWFVWMQQGQKQLVQHHMLGFPVGAQFSWTLLLDAKCLWVGSCVDMASQQRLGTPQPMSRERSLSYHVLSLSITVFVGCFGFWWLAAFWQESWLMAGSSCWQLCSTSKRWHGFYMRLDSRSMWYFLGTVSDNIVA